MSTIAWLDHAENDRRRMLAVIDLFREQDTVDELGLAGVWDAFAGLLVPGTGTVQTRARYFLFVPWAFQAVEGKRVPSARAAAAVRRLEVKLIGSLLAGGSDQRGIIGRQAGAQLKRMPSNIYWSGLGRLGIRRFPGSIDQLIRSFDSSRRHATRVAVRDDDGETADALAPVWDSELPVAPAGFPESPARLELNSEEAEFLRARIRSAAAGSLLEVLLDPEVDLSDAAFPWHHPDVLSFRPALREQLHHAQRFSESVHGAALLYNLLLARQKAVPELVDHYEERLWEWSAMMKSQGDAHRRWVEESERFWAIVDDVARVHRFARGFVSDWSRLLADSGFDVADDQAAAAKITARERQIKVGLARLGNPRALDQWSGGSGDRQYDFRWRNARVVLGDIRAGLGGDSGNA